MVPASPYGAGSGWVVGVLSSASRAVKAAVAAVVFSAGCVVPAVQAAVAEVPDGLSPVAVQEAFRAALSDPGTVRSAGTVDAQDVSVTAIDAVADTVGDAYWFRGDVTAVSFGAQSGVVVFGVTVSLYDSPFSLDWQFGQTGPVWAVDVNGDRVEDYAAVMINVNGVVSVGLLNSASTLVCTGTPTWNAFDRFYGAGFDTSCFGNPTSFRYAVDFLYEDFFTTVQSFDSAPDFGWAGPVVNDNYVPPVQPPTPPTPPTPGVGGYAPMTPARLLETRAGLSTVDGSFNGIGLRGAGVVTELLVAGRGGVPADASAVVLNVTVTETASAGFVTVFPCGTPLPTASSLNFATGATIPNAVVAKIGSGGRVCFYTQAATHLIVDANGFHTATAAYSPLAPARLLETRAGLSTAEGGFNGIGPRSGGTITELVVAGRGGVPPEASAVVLNVTVTEPATAGFVTVFPCGTGLPTTSNLNFTAGTTIPNAVVAKIGTGGRVCFYTSTTTHLIVDANGAFDARPGFGPLVPARLVDTRPGGITVDGLYGGIGQRSAGAITEFQVTQRGGIPADATAVVLNVTVTDTASPGFVTVFPCGATLPTASNLNFTVGATIPNAVVAKVGTNGRVCFYTQAATHLIVDVNGYHT